jgi:hypothetical protein
MANNRMYLVHATTGTAILLAKYYPTTGWYQFHSQEKIDDFFARFNKEPSTFGDTGFELRYEADADGNELIGTENFPYNYPDLKAVP